MSARNVEQRFVPTSSLCLDVVVIIIEILHRVNYDTRFIVWEFIGVRRVLKDSRYKRTCSIDVSGTPSPNKLDVALRYLGLLSRDEKRLKS